MSDELAVFIRIITTHYMAILAVLAIVVASFPIYQWYKARPSLRVRFVTERVRDKTRYKITVKKKSSGSIKITSYGITYKGKKRITSTLVTPTQAHSNRETTFYLDNSELIVGDIDYVWVTDEADNHYRNGKINRLFTQLAYFIHKR